MYGVLVFLLFSLACVAQASTHANSPNKHMVIIGASYAEEWHIPPLPGYSVTNNAICGQVTSVLRAHFKRDAIDLNPDTVLIWGHNNDLIRSTPENMAATEKKAKENLQAMVEQARAAGITPIVATDLTLPVADTIIERLRAFIGQMRGKKDYRVEKNTAIKALNAWLREYATKQNVKLLDFEKLLNSSNGTRRLEYTREDHSHITPAGYEVINRYVIAQLT